MSRIAEKVTNVIGDKWLNNSNQSNSCISHDKISSAEILKSKKIQMSPNIDDSQNLTSPFETLHENSINPDSEQISEQLTFEKNTEASSLIENSQNDPDYSQDASFSGENINSSKNDKNCESLLTECESQDASTINEPATVDPRNLKILTSKTKQKKFRVKSYFCPYCHSVQTKFARHLELKHKDNPAVQQFISYDKKNKRRAQLIAIIRKEGRYLHNTSKEFNTGILMTARQRQRGKKFKKKASDYVCCAKCKDWYSKATIRMRFVKCDENHKKGEREILKKGQRKANFIHSRANDVLRRDIFPVFKDGILKETIAFDEFLILYGNKLCDKYSHKREYDMIRAELRYLAKLLIAAEKIDSSIKDYSSLLRPKHVETAIRAVKKVAKWDKKKSKFITPSNATRLTTSIKKIALKFRSECIKNENDHLKKKVDNFIELWTEEVPTLINKKAVQDQQTLRRNNEEELPEKEDIKLLEINPDIFEKLSSESKKLAEKFTRIITRGTRGRPIPVLLHRFVVKCIKAINKYRIQAGVKKNNNYVFCRATSNSFHKPYIRIYPLLRKYAEECGAQYPERLRATKLRKHVATCTAMIGLDDMDVDRVDVPVAEITLVGKLLKSAMSSRKNKNSEEKYESSSSSDDSNDEYDEDSENCILEPELEQSNERKVSVKISHQLNKRQRTSTDERSKKKRKISSRTENVEELEKRKIIRNQWTDEENAAVVNEFGTLELLKKVQSVSKCQNVINNNPALKIRTVEQLRAHINNQLRKRERLKSSTKNLDE
ncbi:hypothetical protein KQX54_012937 [Cotesia glomerata]|uniref:Uncharacterized protein n=2 Tax=Cotesia glomerata TaxID=32391 RepID=A0AAV7HXI9_COTGL|nr:hypothetical protein KQX54_012937 [Cotesia glomerata]